MGNLRNSLPCQAWDTVFVPSRQRDVACGCLHSLTTTASLIARAFRWIHSGERPCNSATETAEDVLVPPRATSIHLSYAAQDLRETRS
jgi:hypothetical protein